MITPSQTFYYDNGDIIFTADPGDIRSANAFKDDNTGYWSVGVNTRESYSKIRFERRTDALAFVQAIRNAKNGELARLTNNVEAREAAKKTGV